MAAGAQVLGRAEVQLLADTRQFRAGMAGASTSMRQVDAQVKRSQGVVSGAQRQIGRDIAKLATLAVGGFAVFAGVRGIGAGVRGLIEFDSAMQQSLSIMGNVSDTLQGEMAQAARDVGRELGFAAKEGAEAFFFLASAGLDAEQSIAALPAVAEFARAGMFDFATATDLATDAQSALGLTVKNAQRNLKNLTRVTDVLVKANTLANASVEQFAQALTSEAGAAIKTFGKDVEEGVAVLAAFADQGVKANTAGTGLSRIMRLMSSAAVNNAAAMEELKLEFFDAEGNMRNMADIIGQLEDRFEGMGDKQRTAALESIGFAARVQGVLLPLLGTSDAIREYERELRKAGGTTADVAEKQMKSLENQLAQLRSAFDAWRRDALEAVVPALTAVIKNIDVVVDHIKSLAVVIGGVLLVRFAKMIVGFITARTAAHALAVAELQTAKSAQASAAAHHAMNLAMARSRDTMLATAASGRALAASNVAVSGAQGAVAASALTLGNALKGVAKFIGPTGLLLIAGGLLVKLFADTAREMRETAEAAKELADQVDAAASAMKDLNREATEASIANMEAAMHAAALAAQEAAEQVDKLRTASSGQFGVAAARAFAEATVEAGEANRKVEQLSKLLAAARERLAELDEGSLETLQAEFERAQENTERLQGLFDAAAIRLKKLQEGAEEGLAFASPEAVAEAQAEVNRLTPILEAAQAKVKELAAALGIDLTEGAGDASDGVRDLVTELEELSEVVNAFTSAVDVGLFDFKAIASPDTVLAALSEMEEAAEALRAISEDELLAMGARAEAAQKLQRLEKAILDLRRRSGLTVKASLLEQKPLEDSTGRVAEAWKMVQRSMAMVQIHYQDVNKEADRTAELTEANARAVQNIWEEAARGIQRALADAFTNLFTDGLDGFQNFASSVIGIFRDLAAQIAATMVAQKLGIPELIAEIQNGVKVQDLSGPAGKALQFGAGAAVGGGVGFQTANPLAGGLTGAAAGFAAGGPVGAIVGGVAGVVGGLLGQAKKAKEMRRLWDEAIASWERAFEDLRNLFRDQSAAEQAAQQIEDTAEQLFDALKEAFKPRGLKVGQADLPSADFVQDQLDGLNSRIEKMPALFRPAIQIQIDFWEKTLDIVKEAEAAQARFNKEVEKQRKIDMGNFREDIERQILEAMGDTDALRELDRAEMRDRATELEGDRGPGLSLLLEKLFGLQDAAREAAAAVEEAARAFSESQLNLDLDAREMTLDEDFLGAALAGIEKQLNQQMRAAQEAFDAGEISLETFERWQDILGREFEDAVEKAIEAEEERIRSIKEAAEASRRAAEMERFRAMMDTENLKVRLLELQGRGREALQLQQQLDLLNALQEGRNAEYIATLQQIHALQLQAQAAQSTTKSVQDTARAMNGAARALNAPSGLRLSLLKFEAAVVGTDVGPSFEEATGGLSMAGGPGVFGRQDAPTVDEVMGFAETANGRETTRAMGPQEVHNVTTNQWGGVTIRVSERDSEEEVLRKWKRAMQGTTRRGGVNPSQIGPTITGGW